MDPGDLAAIIAASSGAIGAVAAAAYQVSQTLKLRAEREAMTRATPSDAADHQLLQTVVRDLGLLMLDMAAMRDEQLDHADQLAQLLHLTDTPTTSPEHHPKEYP